MRPPDDPPFPPDILAALEAALRQGVSTDAELQRITGAAVGRYNDTPQAELGGLSPNQLSALIHTDWVSPNAPLRLNQRLTPDDLSDSPLFHNARTLLATLRDEGPLAATATGNLSRKAVATLLPRLKLDIERLEEMRAVSKVINEPDILELYQLRITLQGLGLIYRRKGFRITAGGRELLLDRKAGTLFGMLFMGTVVNPPLEPPFAERADAMFIAFPFAIRTLADQSDEWRPAREIAQSIWPPFVEDELALEAESGILPLDVVLLLLTQSVLFIPLLEAGFLERRTLDPGSHLMADEEFRRTPLFRRAFESA